MGSLRERLPNLPWPWLSPAWLSLGTELYLFLSSLTLLSLPFTPQCALHMHALGETQPAMLTSPALSLFLTRLRFLSPELFSCPLSCPLPPWYLGSSLPPSFPFPLYSLPSICLSLLPLPAPFSLPTLPVYGCSGIWVAALCNCIIYLTASVLLPFHLPLSPACYPFPCWPLLLLGPEIANIRRTT